MRKILLYVVVFFSVCCFSQSGEIDSLQNDIKTIDNDSIRAYAYSRMSWLSANTDYKTALAYNDSAYSLFEKLNDQRGVAVTNAKYGVLYRLSGDYSNSLKHLELYMNYFKKKNDTPQIANASFQKGVVYSLQGNYEKSLDEYFKILAIYESLKDEYSIGFTLNSIGNVYSNLGNYSKSIEYYERAIEIHQKLDKKSDLSMALSNLANVYTYEEKYNQALKYYQQALVIDEEIKNNRGIAMVNMNIGAVLIQKEDYEGALDHLNTAFKIQKANRYKTSMVESMSKLGLAHLELGNYAKSELMLKSALGIATDSKELKQQIHLYLFKLYEKTNRSSEALSHYKKHIVFKDSLASENVQKNISELEVKYETEKKDREIAEQDLQLQEQQTELQKKQTQYSIMTGIAIILLISSLMGWFLYQQRQKRKNQEILALKREQQVKTLESLMEGEEKERLRIARELHDGVNGDLSAIKYKLASMVKHNTAVVNEVVEMLDRSSEQVRAISHNLVPPALEKFELVEALADYCASMNDIHEQEISFQHLGEPIKLSKTNEVNIYRIIQELVSNSVKHAEATEITVQISSYGNSLQITVEDNGKGFDVDNVEGKGIGLKNIQSRIDYLMAKKDLVSNTRGTSYTIEIDKEKLNDN